MSLNPLTWNLVEWWRKFDRLMAVEEKHGALIRALAEENRELKDRVTRLEAREEIMVAKAEGAAAAAATAAVSQNIAGLAQALGRLEARIDGLGQTRLTDRSKDA